MPSAFEFVFSDQDFIDKFLRDYGDQITAEMRKVLSDYGNNRQANDDDLVAFLEEDSFAPAIGVSRNTAQSIPVDQATAVVFDTQDFSSTDVVLWNSAEFLQVGETGIY